MLPAPPALQPTPHSHTPAHPTAPHPSWCSITGVGRFRFVQLRRSARLVGIGAGLEQAVGLIEIDPKANKVGKNFFRTFIFN